jgi:hypothetical protein
LPFQSRRPSREPTAVRTTTSGRQAIEVAALLVGPNRPERTAPLTHPSARGHGLRDFSQVCLAEIDAPEKGQAFGNADDEADPRSSKQWHEAIL